MKTLFHLSDIHFGSPYYSAAGEAVQKFAADLEPDVIVISGDFTQRAREKQFADARRFMDRLPDVPIVVTPGNHDVPLYRAWERLTSPFDLYRKYISEELNTVHHLPEMRIVSLNSTAPRRAITNGRISQWQIDFARKEFEGAPPDVLRIVVAHHHFAPPPDFEGADVMPKAKRALDAFTEMNVDLILGGHLHRAYIGNSLDVYPGIDREYGIVIAQTGTATSRRGRARERDKNTFNVIRLDSHVIRVSHYMYFDDIGNFVPTSRHIFFRGGRAPDTDQRPVEVDTEAPPTDRSGDDHVRLQA